MEAQVENRVKKIIEQINKENKRKKRICRELHHWKIDKVEKILEKKELNMN